MGTVASRTRRLSACHTAAKPEVLGPLDERHRLADRVGVLHVERHRHPGQDVVGCPPRAVERPARHSIDHSRCASSQARARIRSASTRVHTPPSTTTSPSTTTRSARTPGVNARYQGSARSARPRHLVAAHLGHQVGARLQPGPRRRRAWRSRRRPAGPRRRGRTRRPWRPRCRRCRARPGCRRRRTGPGGRSRRRCSCSTGGCGRSCRASGGSTWTQWASSQSSAASGRRRSAAPASVASSPTWMWTPTPRSPGQPDDRVERVVRQGEAGVRARPGPGRRPGGTARSRPGPPWPRRGRGGR